MGSGVFLFAPLHANFTIPVSLLTSAFSVSATSWINLGLMGTHCCLFVFQRKKRTQRFSRNYPPHGREDQETNSDHSLLLIHLFPKLPKSIYHLLNKGTSTVQ